MSFAEKYGPWALIVGASEGLGAAFADECASRGLNVAIVARRQSALDVVAADIERKHGVKTRKIIADAGKPDFLAAVQAGCDGVEVGFMIFNAAAEPGGPYLKISLEDHMNNIQVNCVAPTQITYWLGRQMAARGRGGLVLVSSSAALQGIAHWVSYGAAKSYELILGEGLWDELRDHGVTACAYVVGSTNTPTFQKTQAKLNLPFAGDFNPADFPEGTPLPVPPAQVAANLFPQLESGPRLYSHSSEQEAAEAAVGVSRAELVGRIGESTKVYFPAGLNELVE